MNFTAHFLFPSHPPPPWGSFGAGVCVRVWYRGESTRFPFPSPWVTSPQMLSLAGGADDADVQTATFPNTKRGAGGVLRSGSALTQLASRPFKIFIETLLESLLLSSECEEGRETRATGFLSPPRTPEWTETKPKRRFPEKIIFRKHTGVFPPPPSRLRPRQPGSSAADPSLTAVSLSGVGRGKERGSRRPSCACRAGIPVHSREGSVRASPRPCGRRCRGSSHSIQRS